MILGQNTNVVSSFSIEPKSFVRYPHLDCDLLVAVVRDHDRAAVRARDRRRIPHFEELLVQLVYRVVGDLLDLNSRFTLFVFFVDFFTDLLKLFALKEESLYGVDSRRCCPVLVTFDLLLRPLAAPALSVRRTRADCKSCIGRVFARPRPFALSFDRSILQYEPIEREPP